MGDLQQRPPPGTGGLSPFKTGPRRVQIAPPPRLSLLERRRAGGGGNDPVMQIRIDAKKIEPQKPLRSFMEDIGKIRHGDKVYDCERNCKDFEDLHEQLGKGAYGVVKLMRHKPSGLKMAVKHIRDSTKGEERTSILQEIRFIRDSKSPYIVKCYGLNFNEGNVLIYMEVMQASLDKVYTKLPKELYLPEDILGKIGVSILKGLIYLKQEFGVMHRDVKPSNILLGFDGSIKLCDFGIAKMMEQSCLKSNVGCTMYLAPERLDPETSAHPYDVRSDVWSFGVTLCELANKAYPYGKQTGNNVFGLCKAVVHGPAPTIHHAMYSDTFKDFISLCLQKQKTLRPKYKKPPEDDASHPCLENHVFARRHWESDVNVAHWVANSDRIDRTEIV